MDHNRGELLLEEGETDDLTAVTMKAVDPPRNLFIR
jgi:hypothetical protein